MKKSILITTVLSSIVSAITVNSGWNNFGHSTEVDLNRTFSSDSEITLVWSYDTPTESWRVYGNTDEYKNRVASSSYETIEIIKANHGYWVYNSGSEKEIEIVGVGTPPTTPETNSTAFVNVSRTLSRTDDTVLDSLFNLTWEDTPHSKDINLTIDDARAYCDNLDLNGISDWRVPTMKEIWYLHDHTTSNPALDSEFQYVDNQSDNFYWSNEGVQITDKTQYYWVVSSFDGRNKWKESNSTFNVRCVSGESHYDEVQFERDDNLSIVKDLTNGLMWQDVNSSETYTQTEAIDYCENLDFAGYSDWRAPTLEEILSIDQTDGVLPTVNQIFSSFVPSGYWTSSLCNDDPTQSWRMRFGSGRDHRENPLAPFQVRCVRTN